MKNVLHAGPLLILMVLFFRPAPLKKQLQDLGRIIHP